MILLLQLIPVVKERFLNKVSNSLLSSFFSSNISVIFIIVSIVLFKARLYNSLNDTQKGMVSNYSTLTKVVEVIEKIEAIGEYGFTAAREVYDALTDDQKALVSEEKLAALEKAEKDYQELIDNNKLKILSISAEKMATDKI